MTNLVSKNKAMISIAICTYNRAASLDLTLQSLLLHTQWLQQHAEILVIDNNSDDHTKELVQSYQSELPVRYVFEEKQGLANARNRALDEFSHSAIIFFDDDITVPLDCLQQYYSCLTERSEYGFWGGKIEVDWQGQKPSWLQSDKLVLLNGLFGCYDLGEFDLTYDEGVMPPFGANFSLHRSLIEKVGLFNPDLGVSGKQIGRGEETDYFQRAMRLGAQGQYLAGAGVLHRFQINRLSSRYLFNYGIAKGQMLLWDDAALNSNALAKKPLLGLIQQTVKGLFQRIKCRKDRYYQCVINMGIAYALINKPLTGNKQS